MKFLLEKLAKLKHSLRVTEKNQIFFCAGLAFWCGCALAGFVAGGWWLHLLLGMTLVLFVFLVFRGIPLQYALIPALLVLGLCHAGRTLWFQAPASGYYQQITGSVYGEPLYKSDGRIAFALTDYSLGDYAAKGKAYCTYEPENGEEVALFDGAKITFSGSLYVPGEKNGAARFDFRSWLLHSDMQCGITVSNGLTLLNTPATAPWLDWASRLRGIFSAGLRSTMGDAASVACGMLLGDKTRLSPVDLSSFRTLGIAHVLAVSGLHVALLGAMVMELMRLIPMKKWLRLFLLAVFLFFYSGITGFSASSLRAGVMLLVSEGCLILFRRRDHFTAIGLTLLLLLFFDPLMALDRSFVLSFSAVGGILLLMPLFYPKKQAETYSTGKRSLLRSLLQFLHSSFAVSLSAMLGTLLPVMYYFHSLPLYGLFINVLLLPYIALLLPVLLLALLTCWVPWLGSGIGWLAGHMCTLLTKATSLLSALPYASIRVGTPPWWWIICGMGLLFLLSPLLRIKPRRRAGIIALLCVFGLVCSIAAAPPRNRYIQLDVGQSDSAILYAGRKTVAVDTGTDGSALCDYLTHSGRDLDALIITHLHMDHVGGVYSVVEEGFSIGAIYLPLGADEQALDEEGLRAMDFLRSLNVPIHWLKAGDTLAFDDVRIDVLWPAEGKLLTRQDANDFPLVLRIDLEGCIILNTSDVTSKYEMNAAVPCHVLKVAHHGSLNSSQQAFLSAASPCAAIITCTTGRSLPSPETLERLHTAGIPVLETHSTGDITIWMGKNGPIISPYLAKPMEVILAP